MDNIINYARPACYRVHNARAARLCWWAATARSARCAWRHATQTNGTRVFQAPEGFKRLSIKLDEWLEDEGRKPEAVRRSMMTGIRYAQTRKGLEEKLHGRTAEELRGRGMIVGVGRMYRSSDRTGTGGGAEGDAAMDGAG